MTALHQRSSIITTDRSGKEYERNGKKYIRKSVEYRVNWYQETTTTLCYDNRTEYKKTEIEPYSPKDGYQYCFTVFSNMLVLRRNGKICYILMLESFQEIVNTSRIKKLVIIPNMIMGLMQSENTLPVI